MVSHHECCKRIAFQQGRGRSVLARRALRRRIGPVEDIELLGGTIRELSSLLRFAVSLLPVFKRPYSARQAERELRRGVKNREQNFLRLCDSDIFAKPQGAYGRLFRAAGPSREELKSLVGDRGLERALSELANRGVCLDIEEFKGRKPVIRPGLRMTVDPAGLDRVSGPSIPFQSSGSSGRPTTTRIDLPGMRLLAATIPPALNYLNAADLPVVMYYPVPSGAGLMHTITFTMAGKPPSARFAHYMTSPWWRNGSALKLAALATVCRLRGISLPLPRLADIRRPVVMARWLKDYCREGAVISTLTGSALRLVQTAKNEGVALPSLVFFLGGEPITERKRRTLEQEGHRVFPWYAAVETGRLAVGCLSPGHPDDMHLLEDRIACIVRPRVADSSDEKRPALLFTTVHPDAYKFLLNVETGDEALIDTAPCGCPWTSMGLGRRIHGVRSFEKLNLEGVSLIADFLSRMVEEDIPALCGGTPADYQFTEEEGPDGITRLVLSVSPAITTDMARIEDLVRDHFHEWGHPFGGYLTLTSSVVIRRAFPKMTRTGKILSVRTVKSGALN